MSALLQNRLLANSLLAWLAAQVLKTIIYAVANKSLDWKRLCGDGGMPSGHSATVTALAATAGITCGMDSAAFAISVILAVIVMHDAMTYASPSLYSATKRSRDDLGEHGENALAFVHPEDLPLLTAAIHRTAETGEVRDLTYRIAPDRKEWRHIRLARFALRPDGTASVIGALSDVTGFKQSEEQLALSEKRYRIADELSHALIWEVDVASKTLYQTAETSRALGYDETVYHNMPDGLLEAGYIHPSSVDNFRRMYADLYDGDDSREYTLLTKDGGKGYIWLRAAFRLIRDEGGRPVRAVGIVEKVPAIGTEMRIFEEELRFSDAAAPSMLPRDQERYRAFYREILAGQKNCRVSLQIEVGEGQTIWERYESATIFDEAGKPLRAVISEQDVTAQMEREAEDERNRLLLERVGTGIFDYDFQNDFLRYQANAAGNGLQNRSHSRFIETLKSSGIMPDESADRMLCAIEKAAQAPIRGELQFQGNLLGMGQRWYQMHYVSMTDDAGKVYRCVGQVEDISDEKDREELNTEIQLRLGSQTKETFAYNPVLAERALDLLYGAGDDLNGAIDKILETMGLYAHSSRAYIFEDAPDHRSCRNTFEWCASGVAAQRGSLQNYRYRYENGENTYFRNFNADGIFYCSDVRTLSQDLRGEMDRQGIFAMEGAETINPALNAGALCARAGL